MLPVARSRGSLAPNIRGNEKVSSKTEIQNIHAFWITDPNHIHDDDDDMHVSAGVSLLRRHTSAVNKRIESIISLAGEMLSRQIQNNIPAHLIHVRTKAVMGKAEIMSTAHGEIRKIIEAIYHDCPPVDDTWWQMHIQGYVEEELRYAVLSHRWLNRGEITLQDSAALKHDSARPELSPGLHKLHRFCAIADEQGCKWAWADTCCIDKTSSAELDEAIRSMFRWYTDAAVCAVYLAGTTEYNDIAHDEWFTRGWTLQELLASHRRIQWYNKDWEQLAYPTAPALSQITAIPAELLTTGVSYRPGTDRIREKMTWISRRKTTRMEDIAYSVTGIFDINVIPAYGEGTRAFFRLQVAIMERSNSVELFMWTGLSGPENSMLASSSQCFVNAVDAHSRLPDEPLRYIWVQWQSRRALVDLDRMLWRGSRSFELTNAGLRIDLVLYNIIVHARFDWKSQTRPGEFTSHGISWKQAKQTFSEVTPFADESESFATQDRMLSLGILDFEWDHGKDDGALDAVYQRLIKNGSAVVTSERGEEGRKLTDVGEIVAARTKARSYFVVLLSKDLVEASCYRRVYVADYITVLRPEEGWRLPETVYIK